MKKLTFAFLAVPATASAHGVHGAGDVAHVASTNAMVPASCCCCSRGDCGCRRCAHHQGARRAMTKTGVMICGHGSRSQAAVDQFAVLAQKLPALLPDDWMVDYGYLEFANPVIRDGLDNLRNAGCHRILAVPGMLFAAMHAKNDIPTVLNTYAAKHDIDIRYGRELGIDAKMLDAAAARIDDAIAQADAKTGPVPLSETALVVIGRGASDPDANSNVSKITRLLWEGRGFGWAETGYSGVTFPLVAPTLEHVAKLGYRRIVVFPYFLFTGVY